MKTIIYVVKESKARYGRGIQNTVYVVVNNTPVLIGTISYNTSSFRGHDHEAVAFAVENGKLPKKAMNKDYINYSERGKTFQAIEL